MSTTWREKSNRATDALYSIEDATATTLAATTIDQQVAPNDRTESGALWEDLATVNITGGALIVKLTESAGATGQIIADAVRIEKLASARSLSLAASSADAAFASGPLDTTLDALEGDWEDSLADDTNNPFTGL